MVRFAEVIEASIEWAATVLFRPFNPKKWLILGFVAMLAGQMAGSSFHSSSGYNNQKHKQAEAATISKASISPAPSPYSKIEPPKAFSKIRDYLQAKNPLLLIIIILISLAILTFMVIMFWLSARFNFIFLEDVVKNDASIRTPFKANKEIGNSLFLFSLAFAAIFIALLGLIIWLCIWTLIKLGAFDKTAAVGFWRIFLTCLPYGLLALLLLIVTAIIGVIINDFVLVVMFKDKVKIMQAWPKALSIISAHKTDLIKYIFIKLGLGICCAIISGILNLAVFLGLLFPAGITAAIFYLIYLIVPLTLRFLYFIILFIVAVPVLLFLIYCLMCLYLPFAVFFRTLSLKFISRLDPNYNLFNYTLNKEVV